MERNHSYMYLHKLSPCCFCDLKSSQLVKFGCCPSFCSVWMQASTVSNGVLVAKAMEGSSLSYYSLSLIADSSDYLFQFSFLPEGVSAQQRSVEVSFPQSQLPIGAWHSLCVVVGGGSARFYTNGTFQGSRYIVRGLEQGFICTYTIYEHVRARFHNKHFQFCTVVNHT